MELVGHRGCGAHNPENTARALAAASRRLSAVEVDVRRCGSGELVVEDEPIPLLADALEYLDRPVSESGRRGRRVTGPTDGPDPAVSAG